MTTLAVRTLLATTFAVAATALFAGGCSSADPTVQDPTPAAGSTDEAVTGALYSCLVAIETDQQTCIAVGAGGEAARRWNHYQCIPFCPTRGCVSSDYYYYYLEVDHRNDGGACQPQSSCRVYGYACSQNSDCCTYNCQFNGHYKTCH